MKGVLALLFVTLEKFWAPLFLGEVEYLAGWSGKFAGLALAMIHPDAPNASRESTLQIEAMYLNVH